MSAAAEQVADQVVVLCGGRATRLGPLARTTPKALQEVGGHPFLDLLLDWVRDHGLHRVHLCLGHLAGSIQDHVRGRGPGEMCVTTTVESTPLGTAGALKHAVDELDDVFLLLMGDTWLDVDLAAIASALPTNAEAMMVVTSQPSDVGPNIEVTSGMVSRYNKAGILNGWTDTGVAVVRRRVIARGIADAEDGTPVDLVDLFGTLIDRGELAACTVDVPFYDIGTLVRIDRLAALLERGR